MTTPPKTPSLLRRLTLLLFASLTGLCLLLVIASALSNLGMPSASPIIERLSEADKIRLAETAHLRQTLGSSVWAGWGEMDIPAIAYNESYAFLVGFTAHPPDGWIKVPANLRRGGPWEMAPGDDFQGQPYYRQSLPAPDQTPEAFTVRIGERWVSSMTTLDWMKIGLAQSIRVDLPSFLRPVFPYRLFTSQLLSGDDQYISLAAHEAFHAFQGQQAYEKFAAAERANAESEDRYPWQDQTLQAGWQAELDLLARLLKTTDPAESADIAAQFLEQRAARRQRAGLSPDLIAFEKQREWLEGLARYTELEIWRLASQGSYQPIPASAALPDFERYTAFERRWEQEIAQLPRMAAQEGEGRFYYTGMAQAVLLDRLAPGWKTRVFDEGVWLEDLLAQAIR